MDNYYLEFGHKVICQPNDEQIVALFYDNCMDAKDNYFYAKQLDSQLKELF